MTLRTTTLVGFALFFAFLALAACEDAAAPSVAAEESDGGRDTGTEPVAPVPDGGSDGGAVLPVTVRFRPRANDAGVLSAIFYETGKAPVTLPFESDGTARHAMVGGDVSVVLRESTSTGIVSCLGVEPGDDLDLDPNPGEPETLPVRVSLAPFAGATRYEYFDGCGNAARGTSSPLDGFASTACLDDQGRTTVAVRALEDSGAVLAFAFKVVARGDSGPIPVQVSAGDWAAAASMTVTAQTLPAGGTAVAFKHQRGRSVFDGAFAELTSGSPSATLRRPAAPLDFILKTGGSRIALPAHFSYSNVDELAIDALGPQAVSLGGALPFVSSVSVAATDHVPTLTYAGASGADFRDATGSRAVLRSRRVFDGGPTVRLTWGILFAPGTRGSVTPPSLPPGLASAIEGADAWRLQELVHARTASGYSAFRRDVRTVDRIRAARYLAAPGTVQYAAVDELIF